MHLRNILMVFYLIGKAHDLSNRCASSWHVPSRELGTCSKELDGLYCMHQLFPGRKPHKLYSVVFEGVFMKNKKNLLFIQNSLNTSSDFKKSHRFEFKRKCCRTFFRMVFKALEMLLVVIQIIQGICEIFKK